MSELTREGMVRTLNKATEGNNELSALVCELHQQLEAMKASVKRQWGAEWVQFPDETGKLSWGYCPTDCGNSMTETKSE